VLTEVASARIATPMQVAATELQGGTKGLITYEQQINFPNPWPGGIWRLRDIMDYELLVSDAALETMSKYRRELLRGVATMASQAVHSADSSEFWRIPMEASATLWLPRGWLRSCLNTESRCGLPATRKRS